MSNHNGTYGNTIFQEGYSATAELNETKALIGTMSSSFEVWETSPTLAPVSATTSPRMSAETTFMPSDSPTNTNAGSMVVANGMAVMLIVLLAWL